MNRTFFNSGRKITMVVIVGIAAAYGISSWVRATASGGEAAPESSAANVQAVGEGADASATPSFDNTEYDGLLKKYVDEAGWVDYPGLIADRAPLDRYVAALGQVTPAELQSWSREDQLAFYINAYNAITLVRIIDNYPPKGSGILFPKVSIRNITGVWKWTKNNVAGEEITLDALEHEVIRAKFGDARIHASIVCASISCPALLNEAFTGENLEEQLERASTAFATDPSRNLIDIEARTATISEIFDWFAEDFESYKAEVPGLADAGGNKQKFAGGLGFLARYGGPEVKEFLNSGNYTLKLGDYDWGLNERQ